MKRKNYLNLFLAFIIATTATFTSCDDGDDGGNSTNYAQVGDNSDDLSHGLIVSYGQITSGIYNHDLILLSSGITLGNGNENASGKGTFVYFEMFTSMQSDFKPGVYTFETWEEGVAVSDMSFDIGEVIFDYDLSIDAIGSDDMEKSYTVNAGTVTIAKSGSEYTIDIDCTVEGGIAFKGNYKGSLPFNSDEVDKKSARLTKSRKL